VYSKVDLHSHTDASDGSLSVHDLIKRAIERQIDLFAVTDHDTTASHEMLKLNKAELDDSINIIPSVEISTVLDGKELHIVGLNVDINNTRLQSLLRYNRQARAERAEKTLVRLEKSGLKNFQTELQQIVPSEVICRSHFAQLLCEQGIVKNFQKAFKKYLGRSGKAWVPILWKPLEEVIACIKDAGGVAVLAHPSKYKFTYQRLELIIDEFVALGGEAIEIAYPGLNPAQRAHLVRQVEKHDLMVSQGSDFHHPGTVWTELGAFGVNPKFFNTVWSNMQIKGQIKGERV